MIIAIHQPNFLPWLGYFNKMINSDIFVLFDDVQFPRGHSFGNRVQIKTKDGSQWLTVPVKGKSELIPFNQVLIDNSGRWLEKTLKTLSVNYKKSPYFEEIFNSLSSIFYVRYEKLFDLNYSLLQFVKDYLKIRTNLLFSSQIISDSNLNGSDKIKSILKKLDASVYLSGKGKGSTRYVSEELLLNEKIELCYQDFTSPIYRQLNGNFIANLSIIDLLFNCGKNSVTIISGQSPIKKFDVKSH